MGYIKAAFITAGIATAVLALSGCSLYDKVVQPRDGGNMTNPDAVTDGKELVSFRWDQSHNDISRCFSLYFYIDDEQPLVSGSFYDNNRNGAEVTEASDMSESSRAAGTTEATDTLKKSDAEDTSEISEKSEAAEGAESSYATTETGVDVALTEFKCELTYVQWFDLQRMLAEAELPEYQETSEKTADETSEEISEEKSEEIIEKTSDEISNESSKETSEDTLGETDSKLTIVWHDADGTDYSQILDGSEAEALESYVLDLVRQVYDAAEAR